MTTVPFQCDKLRERQANLICMRAQRQSSELLGKGRGNSAVLFSPSLMEQGKVKASQLEKKRQGVMKMYRCSWKPGCQGLQALPCERFGGKKDEGKYIQKANNDRSPGASDVLFSLPLPNFSVLIPLYGYNSEVCVT